MSAQFINTLGEIKTYLPWISFMAGLGGSLHCVGMCGGLVTASCEKSHDVFRYQFGRLLGYLLLGALAGVLGSFLNFKNAPPMFSIIPALIIGIMFIYWGVQSYFGKKAELPTPKFLGRFYRSLWMKLVHKNQNFTKAFFTGLISILLPCGLLYGVIIGTVGLQSTSQALMAVFFFWLGTVPSMVVAPGIVNRFLKPLKATLPKTYAVGLVLIGVMTISARMVKLHGGVHESMHAPQTEEKQAPMKCH